jgi:hypothetical protein
LVGAAALSLLVGLFQAESPRSLSAAAFIGRKALLSTYFGLLTQKTFARVYKQVRGEAYAGHGTPGFLLRHPGHLATLEIFPVPRFSLADFRVSRKRGKALYKLASSAVNLY